MLFKPYNLERNPFKGFRVCYSDHDFDLFVWFDRQGDISSFQLCYDKLVCERAITWSREHGFGHYSVDWNGIMSPVKGPLSPDVKEQFQKVFGELDPDITTFITGKLERFPDMAQTRRNLAFSGQERTASLQRSLAHH